MSLKKYFFLFFILFSVQAFSQKDYVKIGGALRYNLYDKSWVDDKTDPQIAWDTWRLNVDARTAGIDMSFEYRFYPADNTHFLHHGWFGYGFNEDLYMKLGVSQVPFGIYKFASHSWWFQIPYYVGLEDDYDMGVKFDYTGIENLTLNLAYYHQAEPQGTPNYSARYSYDITTSADASIKEAGQLNLRAAYKLTKNIELGLSGQYGHNYNSVLETSEASTAFAAHVVADFGNFNFKGEYINYNYGARDNAGNKLNIIQMGAYAADYNIAAKANIYVAGLAYNIDVKLGPITNIQPYVDYSIIDKSVSNFESTQHLVPGFLITAGSVYTYVDYALGKNNAWLGAWTDGLAEGSANAKWESRFNINMGFYF
ncbi:MAG: hypothetical protein PHS59_07995 [Paludibacter sp.]|nr:hypothetical protein [Paludibacter sp.]